MNTLLNATGIYSTESQTSERIQQINLLNTSSYKSIGTPQKRLSVSPIISTYSFYNKLNLNSPLAGYQQQQIVTSVATQSATNSGLNTQNTMITNNATQSTVTTGNIFIMIVGN